MNDRAGRYARILWDYLRLGNPPDRAEGILILGSHDLRVADRAVELLREGLGSFLLFSGGMAHGDVMADRARSAGVPEERIIRERRAANTGENILFADEMLKESGRSCENWILVQKPYMERRAWATARALRPDWKLGVASPELDFDEYPDPAAGLDREKLIHIMVGDLQRIRDYPARGFQIPQTIPEEVQDAFEALVDLGYTARLL